MAINSDSNPDRFQFNLRTLLIVVTAACLGFGLLAWLLPDDLSIEARLLVYVVFTAITASGAWAVYRSKQRTWKTPEDCISVKVDAKWLRRVKSPFIFMPIATFTGVSVTFAPLYLFSCGQIQEFGIFEWVAVPLCFLVIYLVPGFYMNLAGEVIAELLKAKATQHSSTDIEGRSR
jgi:hypothetical protein